MNTVQGYRLSASWPGHISVNETDATISLGISVEPGDTKWYMVVSGDVPRKPLYDHARTRHLPPPPVSRLWNPPETTDLMTVMLFEQEEGGWTYLDVLEVCRSLKIELVIVVHDNLAKFYHRTEGRFNLGRWLPRLGTGQTPD